MKKLLSLTLAGVLALSLFGCSNSNAGASTPADETSTAPVAGSAAPETSQTPETVTITSLDASGAETQLEVPYDPQRIAILDMACLDILDALGVAEGPRSGLRPDLPGIFAELCDRRECVQPGHH